MGHFPGQNRPNKLDTTCIICRDKTNKRDIRTTRR